MGRVKQNRGRRDKQPSPLHWTPLQQSCGCVVEWGWDTEAFPPPVFIEWCLAVLDAPCMWHGAEAGVRVPRDAEMIQLRTPRGLLRTRQAKGDRCALGAELTWQAKELTEKLKQDDISGILVDIPAKYQRVMRAKGYDPAETWLEMRMADIFLNHGRVTLTNEMIEMLPEPKG